MSIKKMSIVVSSMLLTTTLLFGFGKSSTDKPVLSDNQQIVALYAKEIDKLRQENNILRQQNNALLEERQQLAVKVNTVQNDLNNLSKLQDTPPIPWNLVCGLSSIPAIISFLVWWSNK